MIMLFVIGRCNGKFNIGIGIGTCFTEVVGTKLRSSIIIDLSDVDVFNSGWVIAWVC
jgi:hypothetical protein